MGTRKVLLALLAPLLMTTGCLSFSDRGFDPVTREISRQAPQAGLKKEFALSVGAALINTIDLVALDTEFDFSAVDRVQIAVYQVSPEADFSAVNVPDSLAARDPSLTWETVVNVRQGRERTWVLVGIDERRGTVNAVSVMAVEDGEMVLINVDGELQEMIEFAFRPARGKPGAFTFT